VSVPIGGVAGVAPTAPAAPAATAAPTSAPGVATPPATQLVARIAPLRLDADGVHRLTVNLHPADLGPVQVIAEIRNGEINVQLSGSTEAGNDALRDALADLKRDLEDSGFSNCTLDLRQGNGQQDQARQQFSFLNQARQGGGAASSGTASPAPEPAPARPAGTGNNSRLDIEA
jgi:flagellar hook-length control protein FliK